MADPTRFDLSRLEGCTGTVSESAVAVPHALKPARYRGRDSERPRGRPGEPTKSEDPGRSTVREDVPLRSKSAPPNEESPETPECAPTTKDASEIENGSRAPSAAAPAAAARPLRPIEPDPREAAATSEVEREGAEVPLGFILALTLAAWLPVLLIWSMRIG